MKRTQALLALVLVAALTGCTLSEAQGIATATLTGLAAIPTPTMSAPTAPTTPGGETEETDASPTALPTLPLPTLTETPPPVAAPDPVAARDVALSYLVAQNAQHVELLDLAWSEENVTPTSLAGASTVCFCAQDWTIAVAFPLVAPQATVYHVKVTDEGGAFRWQADVDASWSVNQTPLAPGLPTFCTSNGTQTKVEGAEWVTYTNLVLLPEGAGRVGIAGVTPELEAEIVALRDKQAPGNLVHIWGTLTCNVPDTNGCQLVATRLRYGATYTEPEPVEGWEGTLTGNKPGTQFDDFFRLSGRFGVAYGLHSLDAGLQEQLDALRDTGKPFRVWGVLRCGVPDAFGSQIEVTRIEM
jgi:hypothetical protein